MNAYQANPKNITVYRSHTSWLWALTLATLVGTAPSALADCDCESPWIIDYGETCVLSADCTVERLTISYGGRLYTGSHTLTITGDGGLTICFGGKLIVDGAGTVVLNGGGTSPLNGRIELQVSGSTLRFEDNSVTLSGIGYVEGQSNGARIEIAAENSPGISLISSINIVGALEIAGLSADGKTTGTFTNSDIVHADGASGDKRITVESGTIDGSGTWQVSHSDAEIQFDVAATGLSGTFDIDAGTLDINEDVTTTGDLEFSGGTIEVAATKTFQAS